MPATNSHHPTSSASTPRLSVVVVNYNGWPDVARLASVIAATSEVISGNAELLIVDNASDGPVPESLTPPSIGVRVILREDNGGFAAGVNAGVTASRSPWLLLLNPDVVVDSEFLTGVLGRIDVMERRPSGPPGIVGFALKNEDGTSQPSVGAEPGLLRSLVGQFIPRSRRKYQAGWRVKPGPVPWVTGACILIDGTLMNALGGMDEDFFLYYEEVALCLSARAAGRTVEFDDDLSIVHLRPLQNRDLTPKMSVIVRHAKMLFFRKHLPRWQFVALSLLIHVESSVRGRLAKQRGNRASAGAWRAISSIATRLRRGGDVRGREVLLLAERAVDVATRPIPGVPHRAGRRSRAVASSRKPH